MYVYVKEMSVYILVFNIKMYLYTHVTFSVMFSQTGRFVWLDGAHWNYTDWLTGEPNNTADVENCVELLSKH